MQTKTVGHLVLVAGVGVLALVAGYFVGQWRSTTVPATVNVGMAPEFALADLSGHIHRLSQWRGKVVVLNFWATWCPPCREEIPLFIEFQQRYGNKGLQFVGIAIDTPAEVNRFHQQIGINYPSLVPEDSQGLALLRDYGNPSGNLPYSVVIDRKGRIIMQKIGIFHREELDNLLNSLLSLKIDN